MQQKQYLTVFLALAALPRGLAQDPDRASEPPPGQIHAWLEQLSDPSFAVREQAVQHLYATGPRILDLLGDRAAGDDFEAALRARHVIERIHKLFFVGARVELSAEPAALRWDQPIELKLRIINPNSYPVHLPFLTRDRGLIDRAPLAAQIGGMLDAADYLMVTAPSGARVELTVEDFRGEPAIEQALDTRVYDEPASLLAPGGEFVLSLPEFNRGFARYRMLEAGSYSIRFAYVPEWDDPNLVSREVGKVLSDAVLLNVTEPAPEPLLRSDGPLKIDLTTDGSDLRVLLTCTHDRPVGVNLNLGLRGLEDHAQLQWVLDSPQGWQHDYEPFGRNSDFTATKLQTLQPGRSIELYHGRIEDVLRLPGLERRQPAQGPLRLQARYTNMLDRAAVLHREGGDPQSKQALYEAVPLPMFTGSASSPFVEIMPQPAKNP